MTDQKDMPSGLWTRRSVDETLQLYAEWATDYEADVGAAGYATPTRITSLAASAAPDKTQPVLDFGCGTGLSGAALSAAGFTAVDGTDISAEMLAIARAKSTYRTLTLGTPGTLPDLAPYRTVTATGVISLGAAPADTLAALLTAMAPGAHLVFSYNDATLRDPDYQAALAQAQTSGTARLLVAQYGPHLPEKEGARGSTVFLLERL